MKKIILTFAATLVAFGALAQKSRTWEVEAGLNSSKFHSNLNLSRYGESKLGFHLGLRRTFAFSKSNSGLYSNIGLFLSQRGMQFSVAEVPNEHGKIDLNYLELPVHLGYKYAINNKVALFGEVGPYVALGLFGNTTTYGEIGTSYNNGNTMIEYGKKITPSFDAFDRFDAGVGFRVGAELYKHFNVSVGYDWGAINGAKAEELNFKNRNFTFSVGYIF